MIANKIAKYFTPVVTSLINARLPRIIAIEATNTCFLECVTCPIPHTMTRSKGNMSLATFKTLL
ncbi:MAG: hypothetical protein NTV07_00385, partial [Candidatus Omnitrophica bacterium]|nr:hypothetical protein [Candidatus Omnitrophota bacterium]